MNYSPYRTYETTAYDLPIRPSPPVQVLTVQPPNTAVYPARAHQFYAYQPQVSPIRLANTEYPRVITVPQTRTIGNYGGQIAFACFTFWFCGFIFGLVAFILAMIASDYASAGRYSEAGRYGTASLAVSITGVVVTCIVVSVTVAIEVTRVQNQCWCQAYFAGPFAYYNCGSCI